MPLGLISGELKPACAEDAPWLALGEASGEGLGEGLGDGLGEALGVTCVKASLKSCVPVPTLQVVRVLALLLLTL